MTRVIFLLLEQSQIDAEPTEHHLACLLATDAYRQKRRALVMCRDKAQAEAIDELLWQRPVDAFVPHNLTGEGPANGPPVEIAWQSASSSNRQVLVNLAGEMPANANRYATIYDFVPAEEARKPEARERYKQYRAAGYQMDTQPAKAMLERNDG